MTKPVYWGTQLGHFNTNYTSKVKHLPHGLYATNILMCNFHVDELQGNHR